MLKGKLLQEVCREIKELRDKGKIPDDFAEKKYGFKSWVELLKTVDEEAPDVDKLEALKAMFYSVNKVNVQDREQVFNYQLFQIAKRLPLRVPGVITTLMPSEGQWPGETG